MLTLVAAVLAYDLAYESALDTWVALDGCELRSSGLRSRKVRSETKEEKDMLGLTAGVLLYCINLLILCDCELIDRGKVRLF